MASLPSGEKLNAGEMRFGKLLAHVEKAVRDEALHRVREFLIDRVAESARGRGKKRKAPMTKQEMMKLWKGLFYCMWMADKTPVQQELAINIASLALALEPAWAFEMYCRCFFQTMAREWPRLDRFRLDKFYSLVRYMVRNVLRRAARAGWSLAPVRQVVALLCEEVFGLDDTPRGLQLHFCDILLEEINAAALIEDDHSARVAEDDSALNKLDTEKFLCLLTPVFYLLSGQFSVAGKMKQAFFDRSVDRVIRPFIDGKRGSKNALKFPAVDASVLQWAIFELAGADTTLDPFREPLFALNNDFAKVTKKQFVESAPKGMDLPAILEEDAVLDSDEDEDSEERSAEPADQDDDDEDAEGENEYDPEADEAGDDGDEVEDLDDGDEDPTRASEDEEDEEDEDVDEDEEIDASNSKEARKSNAIVNGRKENGHGAEQQFEDEDDDMSDEDGPVIQEDPWRTAMLSSGTWTDDTEAEKTDGKRTRDKADWESDKVTVQPLEHVRKKVARKGEANGWTAEYSKEELAFRSPVSTRSRTKRKRPSASQALRGSGGTVGDSAEALPSMTPLSAEASRTADDFAEQSTQRKERRVHFGGVQEKDYKQSREDLRRHLSQPTTERPVPKKGALREATLTRRKGVRNARKTDGERQRRKGGDGQMRTPVQHRLRSRGPGRPSKKQTKA